MDGQLVSGVIEMTLPMAKDQQGGGNARRTAGETHV